MAQSTLHSHAAIFVRSGPCTNSRIPFGDCANDANNVTHTLLTSSSTQMLTRYSSRHRDAPSGANGPRFQNIVLGVADRSTKYDDDRNHSNAAIRMLRISPV